MTYADEIALKRFQSGEWICNFETGKIYRVITGTLVDGYRIIGTNKKGDTPRGRVMYHRAVWIAAHNQTIPDGMQIDHRNGIRSDNCLANLQICTDEENKNNPATKWKKYGERNPNAKLTDAEVEEIRRTLREAEEMPPCRRRYVVGRIAGKYHISGNHVRNLAKGKYRAVDAEEVRKCKA